LHDLVEASGTLERIGRAQEGSLNAGLSSSAILLLAAIAGIGLTGDKRLATFVHDRPADGRRTLIDLRSSTFVVANSGVAAPTAARPCSSRGLPTNPYPIRIENDDRVEVRGGLVLGRVPQNADWTTAYCNSAAIIFKQAPDSVLDGMRIAGAWDGIRASRGSARLVIRNIWLSDVRDDAVENDYLLPARLENSLIDGTFVGVSVKPGSKTLRGAGEIVIAGSLIRLKEYPYRAQRKFGSPVKIGERSGPIRIHHSVIAVDYAGGTTWNDYWRRTWSALSNDSGGNSLLWLSDRPIPASLPLPPRGFKVLRGAAAREAWARARTNWINCHPQLRRVAGDPRSDPRSCSR
jgi:hypothetical protein